MSKPLSEREHLCRARQAGTLRYPLASQLKCGYRTEQDCAAARMVLLRGLELVSTPGHGGTETAYAVELPGAAEAKPRQVAKTRRGKTRKANK